MNTVEEAARVVYWLLRQEVRCVHMFRIVFATELGLPTSVDLVSSEPAHMVTSFTSGHIGLFNMETQQLVLTLESAGPAGN